MTRDPVRGKPCTISSTVLSRIYMQVLIVVALDEMHSGAVLSLLVFFVCEVVAVGVGASGERAQSAPAQTAPQQAGFGSQTERLLFFLGKPRT